MSEPFLSEIKIVSFNFAPKGWALCNGQTLPINQNQALFALLGTMYGGNGQTTFQLPNLRGRVAMHEGSGHNLAETGGQEAHTVTLSEMPAHTHLVQGTSVTGTLNSGAGNSFGVSQVVVYNPPAAGPTTLEPSSVTSVGGSQAHENRQPYTVLNFIIALQGIFPSQN